MVILCRVVANKLGERAGVRGLFQHEACQKCPLIRPVGHLLPRLGGEGTVERCDINPGNNLERKMISMWRCPVNLNPIRFASNCAMQITIMSRIQIKTSCLRHVGHFATHNHSRLFQHAFGLEHFQPVVAKDLLLAVAGN